MATVPVRVLEHPLIQHKLSILRQKETGPKEFRELVEELAMLMAYEVTRDLPLQEVEVETPLGRARCQAIAGKKLALVPILRAGLGMVNGILQLMPSVKVGHIGIYREPETLEAVDYYCKLPADVEQRVVLLLDPMLATGVSAVASIRFLRQAGVRNIKLVCLLAAPEGVRAVQDADPGVEVYTGAVDRCLDEHGYIIPGLGDAGDRLYGTR